jgi:gamma-D-glutamyl-L-lysine dipeptidyl-peptidase
MEFGVCALSVIPMRAEPGDRSEMVSQLLFGEWYHILIKKSKWYKIKTGYDGYEGWIAENQHREIHERYYHKLNTAKHPVSLEMVHSSSTKEKQLLIIAGSTLPEYDGMNFRLDDEKYLYYGQAVFPDHPFDFEKAVEKFALKYLNVPYLWGGRSPFGIDCSGFTQIVYKVLGIPLKRDAYQQAEQGILVDFIELAKEGDLAFFENETGKITHTGIILKEQKIIHASGKVRIDKLDHFGIFNIDTRKYSHKLKFIKRIL